MAKKPHDDLFEKSTMTFGEHLEELRVCLFRAIVGIAVCCLIGFVAANSVVRFFQSPLERAMERYYLDIATEGLDKQYGEVTYEVERMILDEKLVPESLHIDVGRLADALRLTYPEQFGGLEISPYLFTFGDFATADPAAFCRALVAERDTEATPEARCWGLLSEDERSVVQSLANAPGPLTASQKSELLRVLNSLADKPELHQSPEFSSLGGIDADLTQNIFGQVARLFGREPPKKIDAIAQIRAQLAEKFDREQSRRLNKLLLARAFPDTLLRARVNVLPLFAWRPVKIKFQSLSAQEPFMIWMKAGFMTGLVIASPWVFYQIWIFVAAGLYPHEKHYVFLYLPISIGLFFAGASLAFLFVFDPVLNFLFTFNKGMNAEFEPRIGEWLGFVLILPLGFGVSFQLPLVMLFLNRLGIASLDLYIQQWRIAILTICVVSMVLTPADPVSMILMAVPLCFLYLLGIVMCKFMPRGRSPFEEAYEP